MWWIALVLLLALILIYRPRGLWAVLALALALVAGVLYWNSRVERERESVRMEAAYAPEICPSERPVQVTFINAGDTTLTRVLFGIHARLPGYSSIITPYTYRQNRSDKILQPGERYSACFPLPEMTPNPGEPFTLDQLEWSAKTTQAVFQ